MTIRDHLTRCADLERACAAADDTAFHGAEVDLLDAMDELRAAIIRTAGIDQRDLTVLAKFL